MQPAGDAMPSPTPSRSRQVLCCHPIAPNRAHSPPSCSPTTARRLSPPAIPHRISRTACFRACKSLSSLGAAPVQTPKAILDHPGFPPRPAGAALQVCATASQHIRSPHPNLQHFSRPLPASDSLKTPQAVHRAPSASSSSTVPRARLSSPATTGTCSGYLTRASLLHIRNPPASPSAVFPPESSTLPSRVPLGPSTLPVSTSLQL
jgi:hypothetical protein